MTSIIVQSALNRVDASFRKDAVGACNYLLEILMQSNNFDCERCDNRIVLHDRYLIRLYMSIHVYKSIYTYIDRFKIVYD
jgi:hypothetical protein